MIDRHVVKRVAAETIALAVADMQLVPNKNDVFTKQTIETRIKATCWLVSQKASAWFDLLGIEQAYALKHCRWAEWADSLLDDASRVVVNHPCKDRRVKDPGSKGPRSYVLPLTDEDRALLLDGLRYFEHRAVA